MPLSFTTVTRALSVVFLGEICVLPISTHVCIDDMVQHALAVSDSRFRFGFRVSRSLTILAAPRRVLLFRARIFRIAGCAQIFCLFSEAVVSFASA